MEVDDKNLTICRIDSSGRSLRVDFEGSDGKAVSVVLPADCLDSLLTTLPSLFEHAVKVRYLEPR